MSEILEQLELNQSFFYQIIVFAVLFFFLSRFYFAPFMKLFEVRHKKTVEDREAAERLMQQAQDLFDEYSRRLTEERATARKEYEQVVSRAQKEENEMLSRARDEAKKITQDAIESVTRQREALRTQLEADIEGLAKTVSESLLSRKV